MKTFKKFLKEDRIPTIPPNIRSRINTALRALTNPQNKTMYFNEIPLSDIDNILRKFGYLMVDEDGTAWSGFLTGRSSKVEFGIAPLDSKNGDVDGSYVAVRNAELQLMWDKMDSGRYSITAWVG